MSNVKITIVHFLWILRFVKFSFSIIYELKLLGAKMGLLASKVDHNHIRKSALAPDQQ